MTSTLTCLIVGLAALLGVSEAVAQKPETPTAPSYTLDIPAKAHSISAEMPSPMIEGTIGCLSDGSFTVNSFLPASWSAPSEDTMQLSVISPTGTIQGFDLHQASDLLEARSDSMYDVGARDVAFLLTASKRGDNSPGASNQWWIVRFDRQGQYKGSLPLSLPSFDFSKLAVFDSGDYLILGVDKLNRLPVLARYSASEQRLFPYQPDIPFKMDNPEVPSALAPGDPHRGHSDQESYYKIKGAIDTSQLVHYKDSILLLQRGVGTQLYQVFANGSLNTIKLPREASFAPDSLLPSEEGVYVRYRRSGTNSGRGDDAYIMEISPTTGDVLRKIHPSGSTIWDVACVHKDSFKVTKLRGAQTFDFFDATARPTQ